MRAEQKFNLQCRYLIESSNNHFKETKSKEYNTFSFPELDLGTTFLFLKVEMVTALESLALTVN
jgi:hypothetical protein